jgi:hypothetical protein
LFFLVDEKHREIIQETYPVEIADKVVVRVVNRVPDNLHLTVEKRGDIINLSPVQAQVIKEIYCQDQGKDGVDNYIDPFHPRAIYNKLRMELAIACSFLFASDKSSRFMFYLRG